jgi:hypothetical protein
MKWFLQTLKVPLLLFLFLGPVVYGYREADKIRDTYQVGAKTPTPTTPATAASGAQIQAAPTPVPDPLNQQNKQMIDWGVLLLGGCVALCISAKLHRIRFHRALYLLFISPAAGFLLVSLWCGVLFQSRVAFLAIQTKAQPDPFDALLSYLTLESRLLGLGISLLAVFAVCFLIGIVQGWVDPLEKP